MKVQSVFTLVLGTVLTLSSAHAADALIGTCILSDQSRSFQVFKVSSEGPFELPRSSYEVRVFEKRSGDAVLVERTPLHYASATTYPNGAKSLIAYTGDVGRTGGPAFAVDHSVDIRTAAGDVSEGGATTLRSSRHRVSYRGNTYVGTNQSGDVVCAVR